MKNNSPRNPEIASMLARIQEKLSVLEQKMDILAGRMLSAARPAEASPVAAPVQNQNPVQHQPHGNQADQRNQGNQGNQANQPGQRNQGNQGNQGKQGNHGQHPKRERPMFKAICADCNEECELPFKPTGDRPVYCRDCYALRKTINKPANPVNDDTPQHVVKDVTPKAVGPVQVYPVDMRPAVEKTEPAAKKDTTARKEPVVKKRPPSRRNAPRRARPAGGKQNRKGK